MARQILKEIQDQPPIDHRDILLDNVNTQVYCRSLFYEQAVELLTKLSKLECTGEKLSLDNSSWYPYIEKSSIEEPKDKKYEIGKV